MVGVMHQRTNAPTLYDRIAVRHDGTAGLLRPQWGYAGHVHGKGCSGGGALSLMPLLQVWNVLTVKENELSQVQFCVSRV